VADTLLALRENTKKPLLACWMGGRAVLPARRRLEQGGIPAYATPAPAVHAIAALADWHDNRQQLLQVPGPLVRQEPARVDEARAIIEGAMAEGRTVLQQAESDTVLAAFRIPILQSLPAASPEEAMQVAGEIGFPVAMKIDSPDITHKTDVGGVRLGLETAREVRDAFAALMGTVAERAPEARLDGVMIEPMWRGHDGRELMVGLLRDEIFGPVVTFGIGGTLVEVIRDRAVSLAPLNRFLAGRLIDATRAARWLGEVRGSPAADRDALVQLLLRVSEMACELPMIREMDINPLIANPDGAIVLDARIVVAADQLNDRPYDHMAIHPYPRELVREIELSDGTAVTLRPIRPEDAEKEAAFVAGLSDHTRYLRFMHALHALSPDQLARFTQIDYDREMALVATVGNGDGERQIAVARYSTLPDPQDCEFAVVVADEWQDRGLAQQLMNMLIDVARQRGYRRMVGTVLSTNRRMREFSRSLGFTVAPVPDDPELVKVVCEL
jgi:acetyltransferase